MSALDEVVETEVLVEVEAPSEAEQAEDVAAEEAAPIEALEEAEPAVEAEVLPVAEAPAVVSDEGPAVTLPSVDPAFTVEVEPGEWECVEGQIGPNGEECGVESLVQREFCLREPSNPICEVPEWTSPDEDLVPVDVAESEAAQGVPGGVPGNAPGELAVTGGGEVVGLVLLGAVALAAGVGLVLRGRRAVA